MSHETPITSAVIKIVNGSRLAWVWRQQSGARSGGRMRLAPAGTADVVGVMLDGSGRFVGIEVKAPDGTTQKARRERQAKWKSDIDAAGGVALLVTSVADALMLLRNASRVGQGRGTDRPHDAPKARGSGTSKP